MNIHRNSIGVEIAPSVLRIANLRYGKGALYLSVTAETRLSYRDFDDLYEHPKDCGDALNILCKQNGIQSGRCITMLPTAYAKSKCVALPLMRRRALLHTLSSRHFRHKHLGVGDDSYRYAWLTTVHDKRRYRLSIYLMAVPTDVLTFYETVFAQTRLPLYALTLSSLAYYGIYHTRPAHRLLVLSKEEAYLAHIGSNVYSHQAMLSDYDHSNLFERPCDEEPYNDKPRCAALRHLSETLRERLRSEEGDNHTLYLAGNLNPRTTAQLESFLNDISLKSLDVLEDIKPASQSQNISTTMSVPIALARWLISDSAIFKTEANFIHNPNNAYYKSAACWVLTTIISVMLFFYYQHSSELNAMHQPQLLYQAKLSAEQDEYQNKLNATKQQIERRRQIRMQIRFLEKQHHIATELWSHLGTLIPRSIRIESIDCRWQSACLIVAKADDYGQIIHFAEQIEHLDIIGEVIIDSSRATQDPSTDTMLFTLSCKFNDAAEERQ